MNATTIKTRIQILCVLLLTAWAVPPSFAAEARTKIKVLLVTGGHGFEKEPFFQVFKDNPEIAFSHAAHTTTNAAVYEREDLLTYDVVVLYDMPKQINEAQKARFLSLLEKGIGLVVLHHALVSYQHWPDYERIIGGRYPEEDGKGGVVTEQVGYQHDVDIPVVIVAKDHPITAGMKDFAIHDEIYWGYRVGSDLTPLITTTHPKSGKPLAWARTEKNSRIVYLQSGHDHRAYENSNYRQLVARSIRWVARR
jgi:type 1 glutamine amidotransferase